MERLHATCVLIGDGGVLLRGPSGAGKSDLALRLIDQGALLVADDYTDISRGGGAIMASAPAALRGLLEVRGLGLLRLPAAGAPVPLRLVVDLVAAAAVERLPAPEMTRLLGHDIPMLALAPFEASAPAKVRLALRLALGDVASIPLED